MGKSKFYVWVCTNSVAIEIVWAEWHALKSLLGKDTKFKIYFFSHFFSFHFIFLYIMYTTASSQFCGFVELFYVDNLCQHVFLSPTNCDFSIFNCNSEKIRSTIS